MYRNDEEGNFILFKIGQDFVLHVIHMAVRDKTDLNFPCEKHTHFYGYIDNLIFISSNVSPV